MNPSDAEEPVLEAAPAADRPILASDLDGTLIPLDGRPENRRALQRLVTARLQDRFTLVFVTGRHKASICEVICEHHLPLPDWVISDVGTTIYEIPTMFSRQGLDTVVLAGGVAANRRLRERMRDDCDRLGLRLVVPSIPLCTDNGAMVAVSGANLAATGHLDDLGLAVDANLALAEPGRTGA